jgi:NAD(P)-dependent dehydrogenase (short-subunit alcohol dehydrogenase family)
VTRPVALVTGATRNLGRQVCLTLAARGHDVALTYSSDEAGAERVVAEVEKIGREASAVQMEAADPASVSSAVATVMARHGRIDALVNNAAIRPRRPLFEITDDDWRSVIDVNLTGPFLVCRSVAPGMVERASGSIVNIAGLVAYQGGGGGAAHIAASKAGLIGLTRALADELGPHGVRANTVVPGRMKITRPEPVSEAKVTGEIAATALRRLASVEEVAATCAFLASTDASFITGQAIHVNGGFYKG